MFDALFSSFVGLGGSRFAVIPRMQIGDTNGSMGLVGMVI